MVSEGGMFLAAPACSDLQLTPWFQGQLRWPLGQQREQSETKEFAAAPSLDAPRRTQGRKDRQKAARSQGCSWLWTGAWKFCHKANSALTPILH